MSAVSMTAVANFGTWSERRGSEELRSRKRRGKTTTTKIEELDPPGICGGEGREEGKEETIEVLFCLV